MSRLIVGALIAGLVFYFVVSKGIRGDLAEASFALNLDQLITIIAFGYALVGIAVSQVISKFIYKKTPMAGDSPTDQEIDRAQQQHNTELIIRSAILEGAGFFCLIAFMVENNYLALIGAVACLFFLVLNLPRESPHLHDIQRRLTDRT